MFTDDFRHQKEDRINNPAMPAELKHATGDNNVRHRAVVLVFDFHSAYPNRLCCFEFVTFFHVAVMHGIPLVTPFLRFTFIPEDAAKPANTALVGGSIFKSDSATLPAIQIRVQWVDGLYIRVTLLETRTLESVRGHEECQITDRGIATKAFLHTTVESGDEQRADRCIMLL